MSLSLCYSFLFFSSSFSSLFVGVQSVVPSETIQAISNPPLANGDAAGDDLDSSVVDDESSVVAIEGTPDR